MSPTDKRKRREWVHIYIAECDAKRLSQLPASLSATLSGLSDRVRIIPMGDDESGTCIIETPDEIIDASAATQLNNIRSILMDTAGGGSCRAWASPWPYPSRRPSSRAAAKTCSASCRAD